MRLASRSHRAALSLSFPLCSLTVEGYGTKRGERGEGSEGRGKTEGEEEERGGKRERGGG